MSWYYVSGNNRTGPIEFQQVKELIAAGKIRPNTLMWKPNEEGWAEASSFSELEICFHLPPPIPTSAPSAPSAPSVQPAPSVLVNEKGAAGDFPSSEPLMLDEQKTDPGQSEGDIVLTKPRPWLRFTARVIDICLFSFVVSLAAGYGVGQYIASDPSVNAEKWLAILNLPPMLTVVVILPVVGILLSIAMALTGTTPGKFICGVNVPVPKGQSRLGFYLKREFKVWLYGMWIGLPLISYIPNYLQYKRLKSGKATSYDAGNPVVNVSQSSGRTVAAWVSFVVLVALSMVTGIYDQGSNRGAARSQTWTNPVTSLNAKIDGSWNVLEVDIPGGGGSHFVSQATMNEFIFAAEDTSGYPDGMLDYATRLVGVHSDLYKVTNDWYEASVSGQFAIRVDGQLNDIPEMRVQVTIFEADGKFWRSMRFARPSVTGEESFLRLEKALQSTVLR